MFTQTIPTQDMTTLSPALLAFGQAANEAAERAVFALYQERRPENTRRAQKAALALFGAFMLENGIMAGDLYGNPAAWSGITWGLVKGFEQWLLGEGYAVKTVNDRVSMVKTYMGLANQAGIVPDGEIIRLRALKGYSRKEAVDTDRARAEQGLSTRRGAKKSIATGLTDAQARELVNNQPDSPQGRRDALLMAILLDHGLRVSEAAGLRVENVNLETKQITFYRQKTGRTSKHNLRGRVWKALVSYLEHDQPAKSGALFLASNKSGNLVPGTGMSERAINARVAFLGNAAGVDHLSPHDLRHYGATKIGHDPSSSLGALMAWGNWSSLASVSRYVDRGEADNDGVSLGCE